MSTTDAVTLTKLGHSCVRVEKAGRTLVLDPGGFSDAPAALEGAHHILITHEHADHLDDTAVLAHLAAHPEVGVHATRAAAERLRSSAESAGADPGQILIAGPGESFEAAGFRVDTVGGDHALIHIEIPRVDNIGYVLDGAVYHPGDSFAVPGQHRPSTVLVPLNAPWAKVSESIDFLRLMAARGARQLIPVHDGLLSEHGHGIYLKLTGGFAQADGAELTRLQVGESVQVPAGGTGQDLPTTATPGARA
ncbi:MBL fold metallo-hydrolase [Micrococcus terreus]|uniref:MBL fold metallo-hydrolase n=1 Tax=Micrococcus terreus TaxID=574650 RepID=UPI00340E7545